MVNNNYDYLMPIPYSIRIGVTGHRKNLPPLNDLQTAIKNAIGFDYWQKHHKAAPNSIFSFFDKKSIKLLKKSKNTPIAFTILSPLAEGSDRIVAKEVLKLDKTYSKIEVVLPLAKEDYLNDFEDPASIKEFEELFQKDRKPVALFSKPLKEKRNAKLV